MVVEEHVKLTLLVQSLVIMAVDLNAGQVRMVYLIIFSRANLELFLDKTSFSNAVEEAFSLSTNNPGILHWVCCVENLADNGVHYHIATTLTR